MSKVVKKKETKKFTIDCTAPADDEILDVANFEAFMLQRVKVDGKTGNLGEKVEIKADGTKLEVTAEAPFSKRSVLLRLATCHSCALTPQCNGSSVPSVLSGAVCLFVCTWNALCAHRCSGTVHARRSSRFCPWFETDTP